MDSIFDAAEGGERGESGDLWDEPDQTVENVKRVRHEQSEEAVSAHLGAGIQRRARPRAGGRAAAVHSCQPLCRDQGQYRCARRRVAEGQPSRPGRPRLLRTPYRRSSPRKPTAPVQWARTPPVLDQGSADFRELDF